MKRVIAGFLIMVVVMTSFSGISWAALKTPSVTGKGAIVYCATTGETIYEKNSDKKYDLASITKLMTCYLAARELGPDAVVTVSAEATQVRKTKSTVVAGEEISVRDLIYQALLISANDSATALAIATSGSEADFVKLMNKQAKKWGMTKTTFKNASGVTTDGHRSSARDIAIMASKIFQYGKDVREIAGTPEYTVASTNKTESQILTNGNYFLAGGKAELPTGKIKIEAYPGVFGGNTGTTRDSDTSMVVGINIDGLDCYVVILGSTLESRYRDVKKLLDFAKENLTSHKVFDKGVPFGKGPVRYGAQNRVIGVTEAAGYINLPEGASQALVTTETIYEKGLEAPIEKGSVVGRVDIYLADELVRSVNLVAKESISKGWFLSRFGISDIQTVVIFFTLFLILALFMAILVLRASNRKKRARARKAKLRQMARQQMEREEDLRQREWPYR